MNWEAIAAIGETAGAAAVVISIVYLSVQIKSNTRATMASASFDASHSWAEFNEHMMLAPDDVLGLTLRTYDPKATAEDLSEMEFMRMAVVHRTIFQKLRANITCISTVLSKPVCGRTESESHEGSYNCRYTANGGRTNSGVPSTQTSSFRLWRSPARLRSAGCIASRHQPISGAPI